MVGIKKVLCLIEISKQLLILETETRDKDRHREKEREKDKERSSSGSSKDKEKDKERETDKEKERKKLPDLDKYWRAVKTDPADFTGWTYLLQYVDNEVGIYANL